MDTQTENTAYATITNPTEETYKTLNLAYDFFNRELFSGKLPPCLITMQRKSKARGYFCAERFEARKEDAHFVHEIALNPSHFKDRSDEEIISTLVHEMAHLWQEEYGKPPRRGYHDREWASKMDEIGLVPSNTEEEGGRRTGQSMSHYIDPNGRYARLIATFLETAKPLYCQDRPVIKAKTKSKNKIKYTCPTCGMNAWGKEEISIVCGTDKVELQRAN